MKNIEAKEEAKSFSIIIKRTPQKFLDGLRDNIYNKIDDKIYNLKLNPLPKGYKKLIGFDCYRIRCGNYRILYSIDFKGLVITILDIDARKEVYKKK
jgi:mRNA interferase RelE/StbE